MVEYILTLAESFKILLAGIFAGFYFICHYA